MASVLDTGRQILEKFRTRRESGWVAVNINPDRVDLAWVQVKAGRRPEVTALVSKPFLRPGMEQELLADLRKTMRLSGQRCVTLLREGEYRVAQVDSPDVPVTELKAAVRWRIKDVLDFSVETATVDCVEIPLEGCLPGWTRQVLVVAAANAVIAARAERFHVANLSLEAIDIPEMAQRNVAALFEAENQGIALLVFNEAGGMLTLTYKGELYLARRSEITATQLRQADDEGRQQLLESICLDMQRTLDNFERQYTFITLPQLLVTSTWGIDMLVSYLTGNLYLPVVAMDLSRVMEFSAQPELREQSKQAQWLVTIGAALQGEDRAE